MRKILKQYKYNILSLSLSVLLLIVAFLSFYTYAYYSRIDTIDYEQIFESGNLDVLIESTPAHLSYNVDIRSLPLSNFNDTSYTNFNQDVTVFSFTIQNTGTIAIRNLININQSVNNHASMLHWIGFNLLNNEYQNIIVQNFTTNSLPYSSFSDLNSSLLTLNNQSIYDIYDVILQPLETIEITFIFWIEWDAAPDNLNQEFLYSIDIESRQYNYSGS